MVNQNEFIWKKEECELEKQIKGGERYAKVWEQEYPKYKACINALLADGDLETLSNVLSSEKVVLELSCITDIAYMVLANQIYQQEVAEHAERTVLDGYTNMDEVVAFIRELRFRIWRMEFHVSENEDIKLVEYIRENRISSYFLKYIIHIAGMDRLQTLSCLAKRFLEYHMSGYAFAMLKYADELSPGMEENLCAMAELCMQAGKKDAAIQCIKQVKKPTQLTEQICRKLREL